MIKKEIPVPDVGVFSLCPYKDKVIVELDQLYMVDHMSPVTVLWDEMTNMEILYEKFKEMRLKSFKPVVEALGVMYSNRTMYEALIK